MWWSLRWSLLSVFPPLSKLYNITESQHDNENRQLSSSFTSLQNKPLVQPAWDPIQMSRWNEFLPSPLIQWITPLHHFTSNFLILLPYLLAIFRLLFLHFSFTISFSLHHFVFWVHFPEVFPNCGNEHTKTRIPQHSWSEVSCRWGTHTLGTSIFITNILLIAVQIQPFLGCNKFVTFL